MNKKCTLFISDLHLEESSPQIAQLFVDLLNRCHPGHVDNIYILGDLFEAWIGDDDDTPFHRRIMAGLLRVTEKGIPLYFIAGNRDFLIGRKFCQKTGCKILSAEQVVSLYGQDVLLMHGDSLCTRDLAYLKARRIANNYFLQKLFLCLPLKQRRKIVKKMRESSHRHTSSAPREIMDVTQEEVERVMHPHRVDYLIHGHTHRPNVHSFIVNNAVSTRIVLGAWHEQGSALIWDATGKKQLVAFHTATEVSFD
jgi:UDP-2,3-diacylglucosamine hydrolase